MLCDKRDALVTVETAAKLALGTRFKRLPIAVFAKLSLPVRPARYEHCPPHP